jgi:uncharacterized protein YjbI with pentapeptide repeats
MATEDKNVEVTEEYAPDGILIQKTLAHPPKKSLTDWVAWFAQVFASLAVVVAIIALVLGAIQFKEQQSNSAQMQATQVAASTMQSLDQQHQTILDTYLDRMSDLLLTYHSSHNPDHDARALAQARTLTAVRNLDGTRKSTLIRFLWEAGLINGPQPIISMVGADRSEAYLFQVNLSKANLFGAFLRGADLSEANLSEANLSEANLRDAKVTNEQLAIAKSLKGATMPDGSIHP